MKRDRKTVGPWAARVLRTLADTLESGRKEGRSGRETPEETAARSVSAGGAEGRRSGPTGPVPAHSPGPARQGALESLLWAHLTAENPDSAAARIHVVSMGEIKAAFGAAEWARLSGKAMMIAESAIRARLGPKDQFCRRGDDAFLLLFADVLPEQAEERVDIIVADIRRHLLGAQARNAGGFGVRRSKMTLDELVATGVVGDERADRAKASGEGMTASDLAARIHRQISFGFIPVWNQATQRVDSFLCQAQRQADYGTFVGTWVLNGGYDDPFSLGVDLRGIEASIGALRRMESGVTEVPTVIIPLHFRSLVGERGARILRKLEQSTGPKERRHIIYEIIGPRSSLPLGSLPTLIGTLKTLGRGVYVRAIHGHLADVAPWVEGADGLGIDLNDLSRHSADARSRARALRDFFKAAASAKEKLPRSRYLWDARSIEEIGWASSGGATLVAGPALGAEVGKGLSPPYYMSSRQVGF